METVLKTVGARKALVGSNPTPSAARLAGLRLLWGVLRDVAPIRWEA